MKKTPTIGASLAVAGILLAYGCVAPQSPKSTPPLPAPAPAGPGDFVETFDTAAGFFNRFNYTVFHSVPDPGIPTWQGDHNEHCSPPTATRTIHAANRAEAIYWCGPGGPATGHIMTSMNTLHFAQISFSPKQVFTGVDRVCWDQNQTELSSRKWTSVVVVPEATYQANRGNLIYATPFLQDAVLNVGGVLVSGETFLLEMIEGGTLTYVGQTVSDADHGTFTTSDKARRFRNCIVDLENGTVRLELQRESTTEVRVLRGALPNGPSRVIFEDISYDPPKDPPATPNPFTWHWDNIVVDA